jgi:CHAT domain-containing protein
VHYRLGEALRRLGDGLGALAQYRAGVEAIEATREPLHEEELKIGLLGRWQQVYEALVLHCLALGRQEEAFGWAERARARAFADAVIAEQRSPEMIEPAGELARAAEVQASLPHGATLLCYFSTGVLDRDLPLLRALPADDLLCEHLLTPARTLLFVLNREELAVHECRIDPNAFATASPRRSDRSRFLAPAVLRRLYDLLLQPAGETLAARRLYLVPHGPLHRVPLSALTDKGGQSLLRAGGPTLAYAPSATVLLRHCLASPLQDGAPEPCLAVGYDGPVQERALRHTEAEATFVARLAEGIALVGPQAKKGRLKEMAGDRRQLHFACHGRFNDEAPLDSYLQTGEGERLTAREVASWRLRAELVTLSACQTGVSRILRGDEPMGLIRAFLYAGARAVLASQWPVEDLPTFLLMQRFYGEMAGADGADPSAALHAAQVWLRALTAAQVQSLLTELPVGELRVQEAGPLADLPSDARPFAHPRFWAAFLLVGA